MKKLLTLLLLVVFVACNKDTDEQKDALATRNGVSADAIFSSQKEIELHKSLVESFSQKEQSFAQEIQALRSRNALTEEVAREKLMPLVNESVHLLNSYGMSNEEIAQDFGSLNDPRIALAGTLITTLEKEKDKGGDIDESKFWDCALETMGFVVKNEERHEIFEEVRGFVSRMSKWFKRFGVGRVGRFGTYLNVGSYIAEFTVCMLDKEYQKQMVSSPYGTINEDNPYSFIDKPLILRENLVTFNLKDNPNQKIYLLKKEINYNEVDHSFEIKDGSIYHLFKYVDKYIYLSFNLANQMNIKLTPGKGYVLHINSYYSYWQIQGNQIDKNSLSEEDIVGNLFDPTFKNNYTPKPYTPPADDGRLILEPYGDGFKVIGKTYDNPASHDPRKDEKLIKATSSEEESKEETILKK